MLGVPILGLRGWVWELPRHDMISMRSTCSMACDRASPEEHKCLHTSIAADTRVQGSARGFGKQGVEGS